MLATLEFLVRLRFDDDDEDCDCRFLEGAEASNGIAGTSVDISTVPLCERFLDLVVGPATELSSPRAPRPNEKELLFVPAYVDVVVDAAAWVLVAAVLVLRVRGWLLLAELLAAALVAISDMGIGYVNCNCVLTGSCKTTGEEASGATRGESIFYCTISMYW